MEVAAALQVKVEGDGIDAVTSKLKKLDDASTKVDDQNEKTGKSSKGLSAILRSMDDSLKKLNASVSASNGHLSSLVASATSASAAQSSLQGATVAATDALKEQSSTVKDTKEAVSGAKSGTEELKIVTESTAKSVDDLSTSAKKATEEIRNEGVAAKKSAADNDRLGKSADITSKSMRRLATVAGTLAGTVIAALSTGAIIRYGDAWSDMQSKVGAAIKDMQAAPELMGRMVTLANATYSPLQQTVDVYARNVGVLKELGVSAAGAADFTEALNHSLVITATRGEAATRVQDALSKAMATGRLQADGLETVLANGGRVAEALANELGVTVSALRQMSSDGKITAQVISGALIGSLEDLREEAGAMPATVADGIVRIQTGIAAFVGSIDQAIGVTGGLAAALVRIGDLLAHMAQWAMDNGDIIANVFYSVIGVAIAATGLALVRLGSQAVAMASLWVSSFVASSIATYGLAGSMRVLAVAIASTGIGALVVIAGVLIGQFIKLVMEVGGFGKALSLLWDLAKSVFSGILKSGQALMHGLAGVAAFINAAFVYAFSKIGKAWDLLANGIAKGWNMIADSGLGESLGLSAMGDSNVSGALADASDALYSASKANFEKSKDLLGQAADGIKESMGRIRDAIAETREEADKPIVPNVPAMDGADGMPMGGAGGRSGGGGSAASADRDRASAINDVVKALKDEIAAVNMTAQARRLQQELQRAGVDLYSQEGQQIADLVDQLHGLEQVKEHADAGRNAVANLFGSIVNGKDAVKSALAQILQQMAQVQMMRAVIGMGGGAFMAGLGSLLTMPVFAKGAAFSGGSVTAFADGGVVSRPTMFPMRGGTGLMGEAGPEAIMPLKRGADGKLGVMQSGKAQRIAVSVEVLDNGNIRAIARDEAGNVVAESAPDIVRRSVGAAGTAMTKTKSFGKQGAW